MASKKSKSLKKTTAKSAATKKVVNKKLSPAKKMTKKVAKKIKGEPRTKPEKVSKLTSPNPNERVEAITLPDFTIEATSNKKIRFEELKDRIIVLYFYPKDKTPGCTLEGRDFAKLYKKFRDLNAEIFGISRDTVKMHEGFKAQECFPFDLLSDGDEKLCRHFDVIKPKNMYGKTVIGIERSTFVFNKDHVLIKSWRKVKVDGHANEVLKLIESL